MKNREVLQMQVANLDDLDHDLDVCGTCAHRQLLGEVAAELLRDIEVGEPDLAEWTARVDERWKTSKFAALWAEETQAGRDPRAAFEARGWTP